MSIRVYVECFVVGRGVLIFYLVSEIVEIFHKDVYLFFRFVGEVGV